MKRQILFRGYSESLNKWVEGDLVHDYFDGSSRVVMFGIKPIGSFPIPVHPDSVGQFTGLCDMEGNRVFEGDTIASLERKSAQSVIFINGAFRLTGYSDDNKAPVLDSFEAGALQITGNTFQPK